MRDIKGSSSERDIEVSSVRDTQGSRERDIEVSMQIDDLVIIDRELP